MPPTYKIKQVMVYIDTHINQNLSIQQLSEHVHISYHYLCKCFKRETGITILQYIHNKRMEHACDLLKSTDYSIAEIAERSGYKDVKKFYVRFKKVIKVTPNTYRRLEKTGIDNT